MQNYEYIQVFHQFVDQKSRLSQLDLPVWSELVYMVWVALKLFAALALAYMCARVTVYDQTIIESSYLHRPLRGLGVLTHFLLANLALILCYTRYTFENALIYALILLFIGWKMVCGRESLWALGTRSYTTNFTHTFAQQILMWTRGSHTYWNLNRKCWRWLWCIFCFWRRQQRQPVCPSASGASSESHALARLCDRPGSELFDQNKRSEKINTTSIASVVSPWRTSRQPEIYKWQIYTFDLGAKKKKETLRKPKLNHPRNSLMLSFRSDIWICSVVVVIWICCLQSTTFAMVHVTISMYISTFYCTMRGHTERCDVAGGISKTDIVSVDGIDRCHVYKLELDMLMLHSSRAKKKIKENKMLPQQMTT